MLILFLGRSLEGILNDARKHFPGKEILVVARDGDQLPVPDGIAHCEVSQFQPAAGQQYTVIANGGTAVQLVPVLLRLVRAGVPLEVYDLQRDGITKLS